ncbi:unnamed protein product [Leuciscus chuanchicus]
MCSQDLRPFAVVEGKGFTNVAQELLDIGAKYGSNVQVEDILPCARTVSRHVEGEYEKIKLLVMEELRQTRDHAVTTDLWTEERTNTHYITVTVHYILDWKMLNKRFWPQERWKVLNPVTTSEGLWRESFRNLAS